MFLIPLQVEIFPFKSIISLWVYYFSLSLLFHFEFIISFWVYYVMLSLLFHFNFYYSMSYYYLMIIICIIEVVLYAGFGALYRLIELNIRRWKGSSRYTTLWWTSLKQFPSRWMLNLCDKTSICLKASAWKTNSIKCTSWQSRLHGDICESWISIGLEQVYQIYGTVSPTLRNWVTRYMNCVKRLIELSYLSYESELPT